MNRPPTIRRLGAALVPLLLALALAAGPARACNTSALGDSLTA